MKKIGWGILALLLGIDVRANQMTTFGMGAKNQALANSAGAIALDAYSQAYNPALMSYQPGSIYSVSLQGGIASFEKISSVLIDTTSLGGTSNLTGDVDTKTPDTFSAVVALKVPLNKNQEHPLALGIVLNSPVDKVMGINTEDSYLPQYSMYLADTQHFNLGMNFSYLLSSNWSIGWGGQLYFVQGASTLFRLVNGGNSTARIRMDVRPGIAPVLGVIHTSDDGHRRVGLAYWGKQDSRTQLDLNNYISTFSATSILVTGRTSMFFDPDTLILSFADQNEVNSTGLSFNLERWSAYNGSAMTLNFQTFAGTFSQNVPTANFRDTISIHLGHEKKWQHYAARIGYAFVPTPVPDQSGELNYLDTDKHQVGLGFSFLNIADFLGEKLQLDLAGLVHYLTPKQIVKTASTQIGYPGYKIGGMVYSYGLTLSSQF